MPTFDPVSFCRRYAEPLYIDHRGRKVVADCEGPGRFLVERGEVEVWVDEALYPGLAGAYADSVVATGSGVVWVAGGAIGESREERVQGRVEACGWVMEASGPVCLDDTHQWHAPPIAGFPLPFRRSAVSEGEMRVMRAGARWDEIRRFGAADKVSRAAVGWRAQNVSEAFVVDSTFADGTPHSAPAISHLNAATFEVPVPDACRGLYLRRTYDRFHGRQRARVLVDGVAQGMWYAPDRDTRHRWAIDGFGISEPAIRGKDRVEIRIDPPAGTPLWNVSTLEVWAMSEVDVLPLA